eukprot:683223_1
MISFMENNTHNRNLNNFPINSPKKCPEIWVNKPLWKLDAMNGYAHEIERYDLEQLNELQKKLKDSLKNVEEAKELYIEKRYFCMVCRENQKNVLLNGCVGNHVVICRECVGKLSEQKCPFCRSDFSQFISFKL